MHNLFSSLFVSCPNSGGLFYIHNGLVFQLDDINTTGFDIKNGCMFRGIQPDEIMSCGSVASIDWLSLEGVGDVHDVLFRDDYLYAVSTTDNSVTKYGRSGEVVEKWQISGEPDSSHINCLGVFRDEVYFSAFGDFYCKREYKGNTKSAGYIQNLLSGERFITGLSQPHSIAECNGRLLVANSEMKELQEYDQYGVLIRSQTFQAYTRGICIDKDIIYLGLSCSRNIEENLLSSATLIALDKDSWSELGRICLPAKEIYDIKTLENNEFLPSVLANICAGSSRYKMKLISDVNSNANAQIQYREDLVVELNKKVDELDELVFSSKNEVASLKVTIERLQNSTSWKVTAPMRYLSGFIKQGKRSGE
ncbi:MULTISPECIES: DUF4915 domain-containing protein [Deefgea]|uniref:DUF4915 domain-containing protein n=1 Tax=Deefgea chitinilytica TaxID=570276 RepID=A0ABS2C779_9NEIS|nr:MULTISPECIES: DUF4915 domain-containing protein [Deefgea]MBM5570016.1 DUF4915 domain-containing protein [Deefgea chitinilytica]MBM9887245.1 DUF4915 domain-containing protein [Deefgea sp. CFH1-16]